MIKRLLWAANLVATLGLQAAEKPNIVYLLIDDMGFSDCGFNGRKDIKIPRIGALAVQGVTFDNPLFLYVPFNAVHGPFQAPKEHLAQYAGKGLSKERQMMATMLTAADEGVGTIIDALTEAGMRENTLLVFSSDNGGVHPGRYTSNTPLRDGKGSIYEGGLRSAAFAVWPGKDSRWKNDQRSCAHCGFASNLGSVGRCRLQPASSGGWTGHPAPVDG